jgi:hypothetical protein
LTVPSEAERGRAVLQLGILAFRWVSLAWMAVLALTAGELRRPALAAGTIVGLTVWTAWLTVARPGSSWPVLAADLGLAVALNLVAGLVMPSSTVGERPYFAAGYPVAAAVTWGAAWGVPGGVAAGLVLGYAYREIADQLFISVKTVQNHVQNILTKLQLSKRYELMRYAIRRGLDRS